MTHNPYLPPVLSTAPEREPGDVIHLNGQVTVADIAALIRVPRLLTILRVVAVIILLPMLILPLFMIIVDGDTFVMALPMIGLVLFLGGNAVAASVMLNRRRRATRLVKLHPDLIGPLRGSLDAQGLTFFSEAAGEFQQVTWAAFPKVTVNHHGVRLDWGGSDYVFIAIPARCIDGFNVADVRHQVEHNRRHANEPPIYRKVIDWSLAPESCLRFQNVVPMVQPSNDARTIMRISQVVCALAFLAALIALLTQFDDYLIEFIFVAVITAGVAFATSENAHRKKLNWQQWGWLTPSGCEAHIPGLISRFTWNDPEQTQIDANRFRATFVDGSFVEITPDDLLDGNWQTLVEWITARN